MLSNTITAIIGLGTSKVATIQDYFLNEPINNVEYHIFDTYRSKIVAEKIHFHLIGEARLHALGTAGDVVQAEKAIKQNLTPLDQLISAHTHAIFLVGLGGGTGTAALPILINLALQYETDFHCFASLPFLFEGAKRQQIAASSLEKVKKYSNKITTIDQNQLMPFLDGKKYQNSTHLLDLLNRAFVWKTMDYLLN